MKLVVDTSVVFSLFKPNSFSNKLLRNNILELFAPRNLIKELEKYSDLICFKAGITKETFSEDISLLSRIIELKDVPSFFLEEAKKLVTHESDAPFLALALELNVPLWTNDEHFKKQCSVKVFTTGELTNFLDSE